MKTRKFTREFKLEAVRLIKDPGVSHVVGTSGRMVWAFKMTSHV
jgi:transposase-like protein